MSDDKSNMYEGIGYAGCGVLVLCVALAIVIVMYGCHNWGPK